MNSLNYDLPFIKPLLLIGFILLTAQPLDLTAGNQEQTSGKELLLQADSLYNLRQFEKAAMAYETSSQALLTEGDSLGYLIGRALQGRSSIFHGDFQKGVELTLGVEAMIDDLTVEESEDYLRLLREVGATFISLRQKLDLGIRRLNQAITIMERGTLGTPLKLGESYFHLGSLRFYQLDFLKAEKWYTKAEETYDSISDIPEIFRINLTLAQSTLFTETGQYNKAIVGLEYLLDYFKDKGEPFRRAWLLGSLSRVYGNQGLYHKALSFSQESIRIFEAIGMGNAPITIDGITDQGVFSANLGKSKEAISIFRRAYGLEKQLMGPDHPNHILTFNSLSNAYLGVNLDSARFYINKALPLIIKHHGRESEQFAENRERLGNYHMEIGDYQAAKVVVQEVLDLRRKLYGEVNPRVFRSMLRLAKIHDALDEFDSALILIDQVIINSELATDSDKIFFKHVNPVKYLEAMADKAVTLYNKHLYSPSPKTLEEAYQEFIKYDSVMLKMRNETGYPEDKSSFWENFRGNNDLLIDLIYERYESERTQSGFQEFAINLDRFKYISLSERLSQKQYNNYGLDSAAEAKNVMLSRLVEVKKAMISDNANSKPQGLDSNLFEMNKQFETYSLNTSAPVSSPTWPTQYDLEEGSAIISYYQTGQSLYLLLWSDDLETIKKIPLPDNFTDKVQALHELLQTPFGSDLSRFESLSYDIYKVVFEPIANEVQNLDKLLILTDQITHLIPFEVLITEKSESKQYKDLNYLIKKYAISYAPSITSLNLLLKETDVDYSRAVALAPRFSGNTVESFEIDRADSFRSGYGDLSWSKKEAGLVMEYFDGELLSDSLMRKDKLLKKLNNSLIIHFATHGSSNDQNPEFSKLLLGNPDSTSDFDHELFAFEVFHNQLNTELAVLGACETGKGTISAGDGLINMANSFFHSGARSVLFSRWLANDFSTYQIMSTFYNGLNQKLSKSEALRRAKLEYLSNADELRSHPFYWSHLSLSGNHRAIYTNRSDYIYIILAALAILLAVYLSKRKAQSKVG